MCGVVGVTGKQNGNIAPVLIGALKKLEYRGYDSAGVATVVDGHVDIRKGVGELDTVELHHHLSTIQGTIGIGHVRWATHGGVTDANAHPHSDCQHRIAVVHNGIIENYRDLQLNLGNRHRFSSETDSEVISHLLEDALTPGKTLENAVAEVVSELKGSFAILAICSQDPGKIVAARRDSPLVVGVGNGMNFIASDSTCFLDHTRKIMYINDDEIVVLQGDSIRIMKSGLNTVERKPVSVAEEWEEATKESHPHFMLKEILEQPLAIKRATMQDNNLIAETAKEILEAKNVVFTACGTSRYAALIGRYAFSNLGGKFSEVVIASEFKYFSRSVDLETLVIAVSQSGETADVLDGVKEAKSKGARVLSITNVIGSTLTRLSDRVVSLQCGPEIAVAATKSFTSQLVICYLIACAMMDQLEYGREKLQVIASLIEENLKATNGHLPALANVLSDRRDFYYLGRGINFAVAGEGALKLKEISYVHAEGMPAGEMKHGTLALIEPGTPVIAICPSDNTYNEMLSNIQEVKARGAFVVGVSDTDNPVFDSHIRIPNVDEVFFPLVIIPSLQLLAYYSALARGLDPDKPRNLAKSVTVK